MTKDEAAKVLQQLRGRYLHWFANLSAERKAELWESVYAALERFPLDVAQAAVADKLRHGGWRVPPTAGELFDVVVVFCDKCFLTYKSLTHTLHLEYNGVGKDLFCWMESNKKDCNWLYE